MDRLSLDEKRAHVTSKELRMYSSVGTLFQILGPICIMLCDDANVRVLFVDTYTQERHIMITYGSPAAKPLIRGHLLTRANVLYIACRHSYRELGLSLLTQTSCSVPT